MMHVEVYSISMLGEDEGLLVKLQLLLTLTTIQKLWTNKSKVYTFFFSSWEVNLLRCHELKSSLWTYFFFLQLMVCFLQNVCYHFQNKLSVKHETQTHKHLWWIKLLHMPQTYEVESYITEIKNNYLITLCMLDVLSFSHLAFSNN